MACEFSKNKFYANQSNIRKTFYQSLLVSTIVLKITISIHMLSNLMVHMVCSPQENIFYAHQENIRKTFKNVRF